MIDMGVALPPRMQRTLLLLAQGYETKEIAARLGVRSESVSIYCWRIKEELGLSSSVSLRSALMRWMFEELTRRGALGEVGEG